MDMCKVTNKSTSLTTQITFQLSLTYSYISQPMILKTRKSLLIHYVTVTDAHLLPSDSAWNIRFQFWLIWCFQSLFVDMLNQFLSIQWASGILVTCIATPLWWRQKVVLWCIKSALLIVNLYHNWVKRLSTFAAINS